jgi:hypothetical protein
MEEHVLDLLNGPAAATVVMAVILATGYRLLVNVAIPRLDKMLKDCNDRMKELMREHAADRSMFVSSMTALTDRIDKMTASVDMLKVDVADLKDLTQQRRL